MLKTNFRPHWIEKDIMHSLGYELVQDTETILHYKNIAGTYSEDYGNMPSGKRLIYFNTLYNTFSKCAHDVVHVTIEEDGGTRTVYSGVCSTPMFLNELLNNVR